MRPAVRRLVVVAGLLVLVALAALLVIDLVASRQLAAARDRFEAEVAEIEHHVLRDAGFQIGQRGQSAAQLTLEIRIQILCKRRKGLFHARRAWLCQIVVILLSMTDLFHTIDSVASPGDGIDHPWA